MPTRRADTTYKLNVRFLAILLVSTLVVGVGAFFLHRYQKNRLVNRFLDQANIARGDTGGEKDWAKELEYLQQYISLNPGNSEARVRYGMVLAKNHKSGLQAREAYFALQKALQDDPTMEDFKQVRLQCVKLALRPELQIPPADAIRELDILLKAEPEKSEYEEYYATALMRAGEFNKADSYLTKVVNRNPTHYDSAVRLAWVRREKLRMAPKDAEFTINEMLRVPANHINPQAWLRAAMYYKAFDELPACGKALEEAQRLVKADPQLKPEVKAEVCYSAAEFALLKWRNGVEPGVKPAVTPDFEEGIRLLKECLEHLKPLPAVDPLPEPGSAEMIKLATAAGAYRLLSQSYAYAEHYKEAELYAREQVAKFPDSVSPYFLPLQLELLDVLVRQGADKFEEAEGICRKLSARGYAPALVELQRGFMNAHSKRWLDAARHLERTVTELANQPEMARRARYMLAMCYAQTNEPDRLCSVLADAIPPNPLDPYWPKAKVAYAEALAQLGRNQEAIVQLKEVIQQDTAGRQKDEALIAKAQGSLINLLIRQREKNGSKNDVEVNNLLKSLKSSVVTEILKAQLALSAKKPDEARATLDQAMKKFPESLELVAARYQLELQEKQYPAALAVVKAAEAKHGDKFGIRNMKIAYFAATANGEAARAPELEALAGNLDQFVPEQRVSLLKSLSFAARGITRLDLAEKWLDRATEIKGDHDLEIHQMRFDLALLRGDDTRIQNVLEDIAKIAGGKENSTYRLPLAFSLLHKADRTKDDTERKRVLEMANEILGGMQGTRKESGRYHLALAKTNDMLNNHDVAIEAYKEAIRLGEKRPEIVSRYIELCYLQKKGDRVHMLLRDHPELQSALGSEQDKAIQLLIEGRFFKEALELARRTVPDDSTDAAKLFWRARIENTCGDSKAAEVTLRKASTLNFTDGNVWLSFVQILVMNSKKAEAKQFVESTQSQLKANNASLFIAQGYALVDELEKARVLFKQLLADKPNDLKVLLAVGGFYFMIGEIPLAAPIMEKIIAHPERTPQNESQARRWLALCTVVSRDHLSGVRALKILGFRTPDEATSNFTGNETLDDLRSRFAVISVIKGRNARTASLALLREIDRRLKRDRMELSLDETLAMGQIQFSLGDMAEANRNLLQAASSPKSAAVHKAIFATFLLRSERYDEAKEMIDQLTKLEPNSQRTAELTARWAVLTKRTSEAIAVLNKFAGPGSQPAVAAAILEQLGLPDDAGPLYQRAADAPNQPDQRMRLVYATYLARRGKTEQCVMEFANAWENVPAEIAVPQLCMAVLYFNPDKPAEIAKAKNMMVKGVEKNPKLRPYLAAFKSMIDEVPEAISISREILAAEPNNDFVLNNLAFMLALKEGKFTEALELIRKAITIAGPQPTFLDTEATILIASGNPKDALERIGEVLADEPSSPTAYMHQAQAFLALGRRAEAANALREAHRNNLRMNEFHPLERRQLDAVRVQLGG